MRCIFVVSIRHNKMKNNKMKNLTNITDVLIIKEHIDHALSNSYEGKSYERTFDALGQEIMIYTREGDYETEVIILSDKMDCVYALNNHAGYQAEVINELINA